MKNKYSFLIISVVVIGGILWIGQSQKFPPEQGKGFFGGFFRSAERAVRNTASDAVEVAEDAASSVGEAVEDAASGIYRHLNNATDSVLYGAYRGFMSWLDSGVSGGRVVLHQSLIAKLKPFYRNDLRNVRVAYTSRISNLAITDCYRVYFSNRAAVDSFKSGKNITRSNLAWLAHELTHTEQCSRIGGRRKYALRWFSQASNAVIAKITSGEFLDIIRDIERAEDLAKYEGGMSMEKQAEKRSEEVMKKL